MQHCHHREASTLIFKTRSCAGRTDLKNEHKSAENALFLRSALPLFSFPGLFRSVFGRFSDALLSLFLSLLFAKLLLPDSFCGRVP